MLYAEALRLYATMPRTMRAAAYYYAAFRCHERARYDYYTPAISSPFICSFYFSDASDTPHAAKSYLRARYAAEAGLLTLFTFDAITR